MKFSESFVDYLKNFNRINPNMNFVLGKVQSSVIGSPSGVLFFAKVKSDTEIDTPFAVANLGNILSILDQLNDPDIEVNGGKLVLSDKSNRIEITLTKSEFIHHSKKPERYKAPEDGIDFNLSWDDFDRIRNIGATVKNEHIAFEGDGEKIWLSCNNFDNPTSSNAKVEVGKTSEIFTAVLNKDVLRFYKTSYKVSVDKRGFVYFTNGTIEYFVPVLGKYSKFGA